jgi:hypothetical protein
MRTTVEIFAQRANLIEVWVGNYVLIESWRRRHGCAGARRTRDSVRPQNTISR